MGRSGYTKACLILVGGKNEIQTRPHSVPSLRQVVRLDQSDEGGGEASRHNLFMLWASSAPHTATGRKTTVR
jgi:hypothetical protein